MKYLLLNFNIKKFRGMKKNLRIKFQMHMRIVKFHQKNCLKLLLPKGYLLGTEKEYKNLRSIKLLLGLSEKE